jgi:alpha-tubulin suppressor-like RCC1 family protein
VCTIEGYCLTPARDDAGLVDAASELDATPDTGTSCGPSPRVLDVAVGASETCAVLADNTVWCWGYFPLIGENGSGESCLGGPRACYPRPVQVPGITDALEVVLTGRSVACVRAITGRISCWGGFEGTPDRTVRLVTLTTPPGPLIATRLIAGDQHVCAERGAGLVCWGQQSLGRLGNGATGESIVAIPVTASELPILDSALGQPFAAGYASTLALSTDGLVRGVGANEHGQLGVAPSASEGTASRVARSGASAIAASSGTTCVLVGGRPRCWGLATDLLGPSPMGLVACLDGEVACAASPLDVPSDVIFEDIVADPLGNTMYGITDDSVIYGWGTSDTRLLASAHVDAPALLPALEGARAHRLAVGGGTACAVLEGTSELRCWGLDSYGQLGRGVAHERGDPDPELALARPPCW